MNFLTSHLTLLPSINRSFGSSPQQWPGDREGHSESHAGSWIIQTAADYTYSFTWPPPSVTACTSVISTRSSSYDQFIKVAIYPISDRPELDVKKKKKLLGLLRLCHIYSTVKQHELATVNSKLFTHLQFSTTNMLDSNSRRVKDVQKERYRLISKP